MGSINYFTSSTLVFFVNGKKVVEEKPNPEWTLLYYLRNKLRLVGSKEGCAEGGCGACTVLQSNFDTETKSIMNIAINACLTPLCSVHGSAILTVEGLGNVEKGLHPVQERIAKSHGTQCGFCTPGFVMSMYALLRNNAKPSEIEMEEAFQGNLCRCTGYRPILDGFKTLCCKEDKVSGCNGVGPGGKCCKAYDISSTAQQVTDVLFDESEFLPYDPTMDIIFPSELQLNDSLRNESLQFTGPSVTWYKPSSLEQLLDLKRKHPLAKIIAGNTEIGVDTKFKNVLHPILIHISDIPQLSEIKIHQNEVSVGAAVTLTKLDKFCRSQIKLDERKDGTVFKSVQEMLRWFGGQQVRNVATVGGNLITASPIADLNPIWMAVGAESIVFSGEGIKNIPISAKFFKGYRETTIAPNEILSKITFPTTKDDEFVWSAKQARRKEDDISIVTTCMRIQLDPNSLAVKDAALVFGGMASVTQMANKATSFLIGKKWEKSIIHEVMTLLQSDFPLEPDTPGGMVAYRLSLVTSMFFKFFLAVSNWIVRNGWTPANELFDQNELSALEECTKGDTKSAQLYQIVSNEQKVHDLIGRPIVHLSGLKHATGEAEYTDDIRPIHGELFGTLVLSTIARGTILSIDPKEALALPGVIHFFDSNSIPPERNVQGVVASDEEIFASKEITCQGQVIGYIVATDFLTAEKAAKKIKIKYEEKPAIVTIEQAIEQESYLAKRELTTGNVEEAFAQCDKIIEGEMRTGGQEHFYMETQSCVVTPKEDGEIHVQVSSQGLHFVQTEVARALGIKFNKIKATCRRMGGAFGGKETRNVLVTLATAIAAKQLQVPVRTVMNRQDDMMATGGRHPFLCKYKVGFNNTGRISAVKALLYSNSGNSMDASFLVLERAIMTLDSAYTIPNWEIKGFACKTNLASNTAFRGFGAPQSTIFCEDIFDNVAETLGKSSFEIRQMHLKKELDSTPCGWKLEGVTIKRCWDECIQNSEYFSRLKQVEEFNGKNRWKKRGIAMMPIKHDLGFHGSFMNQGGALVMIYTDGSVSLNFGGVEMGQGLITKMIQVASRALDIPADLIYFSECSTDKIPNASATCGSMTSDLNGMAIINACEKLVKRLEPFKAQNPNGKWEQWVGAAYFNRINLSATGFYEISHLNYDFENPDLNVGKDPSNYCAFGAACSEVEIDCLTGDMSILRTDIVMDAGESLNPAVDIGQIEGAFVQGFGLICMEELLYSPKGLMLTKGPGMYKIPALGDIPRQFYVSLLRGSSNPKAVYSSKGLGEPPMLLATSIYLALKEAIKAFRKENGESTLFTFDCPATVERIRMTCQGPFALKQKGVNKTKTWAVRP